MFFPLKTHSGYAEIMTQTVHNSAPNRVLLLGRSTDPHLILLKEKLVQRGKNALLVNNLGPSAISLMPADLDSSTIQGVSIKEFHSAHVRALPPRQPPSTPPHSPKRPYSRTQARAETFDGHAKRDPLCALLAHWARQGRTVLNPPVGGDMVENKPEQLSAAQQIGLDIPETRISADVLSLWEWQQSLAEAGGELIQKPVRGGDYAQILDLKQKPSTEPLPLARIVQERIRGDQIRVILLQGQVIAAHQIAGVSAVDFRNDDNYRSGQFSYVPIDLPNTIGPMLAQLQTQLVLPFCGVDLIRSTDARHEGKWFFLEANGAPRYLESEQRLELNLTDQLANALSR
jgi:glutathione synthase/RimK-type ligase-like ATP-grasp enzyme